MNAIKTKVIELPTFEQLTEEQRNTVLENYRDINTDNSGFDFAIDDFKTLMAFIGIDISQVYYSGFYSQGDGAMFEAEFSYKAGGLKALQAYAPLDTQLHSFAKALQDVQRQNFYKIRGSVTHHGRYCSQNCTRFSFEHADRPCSGSIPDDAQLIIEHTLKRLMQNLYNKLDATNTDLTSDEQVKETLISNEYTFNAETLRIDN